MFDSDPFDAIRGHNNHEPPDMPPMPDHCYYDAPAYEAQDATEPDRHGLYRNVSWLDTKETPKGAISLDTIPNTGALLDAMGISAKYNEMTRQNEYTGGVANGREADSVVTRVISAAKSREYKSTDIVNHMAEIALNNRYHPVAEWLNGVVWDGVSRIDALASTLHTENPQLARTFLKRWSVGAVQAAIKGNPQPQQGVLVLAGVQGKGKTTWIKSLCPLQGAVMTGMELDPHKPDSIQKSTGTWITELGEIDGTMRRSDIASLKAFVTSESDTYRMPYARLPRTYPRRTAFAASVNDSVYLKDDTGNRRWWTIPVSRIDYNTVDMAQYWAEIKGLVDGGEPHALQPDELDALNGLNRNHEVIDTYEEAILVAYGQFSNISATAVLSPMTTTMVAESLGYRQPTPAIVQSIGRALKKCGYLQKSMKINGNPAKGYSMPPMAR